MNLHAGKSMNLNGENMMKKNNLFILVFIFNKDERLRKRKDTYQRHT